jgi:hypothetical protein
MEATDQVEQGLPAGLPKVSFFIRKPEASCKTRWCCGDVPVIVASCLSISGNLHGSNLRL